jgi:hypothetical protein
MLNGKLLVAFSLKAGPRKKDYFSTSVQHCTGRNRSRKRNKV